MFFQFRSSWKGQLPVDQLLSLSFLFFFPINVVRVRLKNSFTYLNKAHWKRKTKGRSILKFYSQSTELASYIRAVSRSRDGWHALANLVLFLYIVGSPSLFFWTRHLFENCVCVAIRYPSLKKRLHAVPHWMLTKNSRKIEFESNNLTSIIENRYSHFIQMSFMLGLSAAQIKSQRITQSMAASRRTWWTWRLAKKQKNFNAFPSQRKQ